MKTRKSSKRLNRLKRGREAGRDCPNRSRRKNAEEELKQATETQHVEKR